MITLAVTTRQQVEYHALLLELLEQGGLPEGFELLVCENGAHTEPRIVRQTANSWARYFFRNDERFTLSISRNLMLDEASNNIVLFVDGDILPPITTLAGHLGQHTLSNRPIVAGWRRWVNSDVDLNLDAAPSAVLDQLTALSKSSHSPTARREEVEHAALADVRNPTWRRAVGGHLSLKRDSGLRWDESMIGWGFDDADFLLRAERTVSSPLTYCDNLWVWHLDCDRTSFNPMRIPGPSETARALAHQAARVFLRHHRVEVVFVFDRLEFDEAADRWAIVSREQRDSTKREARLRMAVDQVRRQVGGVDADCD